MTHSVRAALARATQLLRAAAIESARLDARVLLGQSLGISPEAVLAADALSDSQRDRFEVLVARRAAREPLAYITGVREFWSLPFAVGPGVLIPRPETETLVQSALENTSNADRPLRVLDIGTGSGCLLVAFLAERKEATGTGIDSSEAALTYAKRNAIAHGLGDRAQLARSSWKALGESGFDVVFSNPPYLSETEFEMAAPEIRAYEPRSALVAGPDGLDAMRALGPVLGGVLAPSGRAFLEIGAGQCAAVVKIVMSCGLDVRQMTPDLSGVPRCLEIGRPGPGGA